MNEQPSFRIAPVRTTNDLASTVKLFRVYASSLDVDLSYQNFEAEMEAMPGQQRIDEPHKNWKFSLADIEERKFWKRYMSAFEECLSATSTREAPWYVVPADDKENARLIVSQIILDTLNGLAMTYPEVSTERQKELKSIRERLINGDLD